MKTPTHKILIIEDEQAVARSLKTVLELVGHHVETVASADQGLIRATETLFDVVITDLQLPGPGGLELLGGFKLISQLRAAKPHLPVILMTAHHTADTAIEATKIGAYDYVIKPPDLPELLNMLER